MKQKDLMSKSTEEVFYALMSGKMSSLDLHHWVGFQKDAVREEALKDGYKKGYDRGYEKGSREHGIRSNY